MQEVLGFKESSDVRRILIIDDNPSIHEDIRKILSSEHARNRELEQAKAALFGESIRSGPGVEFKVDGAHQGEEGLKMVRAAHASGQPYELAFIDIRMPPGWDGVETVARLREVDPDLQVVICTAYSDYPWADMMRKIGAGQSAAGVESNAPSDDLPSASKPTAAQSHDGYVANWVILKKPFDNIEVLQLAHAMTEKWRLNQRLRTRLNDLDSLVRQRTAELESANALLRREMEEQLQFEQQIRQAQKMEAIGQLAAGIAHDFNNILTVVMGHASILSQVPDPASAGSVRERAREILHSADRAALLVRQLLAFSRKQLMQFDALDLGQLVLELGEVLRRILGERVMLRVAAGKSIPPVKADRTTLEQAFVNLAVNARDAMPNGGILSLSVDTVEIDEEKARDNETRPGTFVCVTVSDTGVGIPPDALPRIFEPFFTTKPVGQGSGLGLATVYGIVKQHRGWVTAGSTVGEGTTFRVYVPAT